MTITRWKPIRSDLSNCGCDNLPSFARMMEDFFTHRPGDMMVWGPNVDILENEESFEIHAELPGVKQEDVKISLDNNVLTLSGEKKQEVKEDKADFHRVERVYGRFERSFSLPTSVKSDKVRASFEDGILRIVLPKAEEAKSRTITIEPKK